jgi:DNA primase
MGAHTFYTAEVRAAVLAHYERAAPFIVRNFPMAPIEAVEYAQGLDGPREYTAALHYPVPPSIPTVEIGEFGHTKRYIAAAENSLLWLVHRNAIGFESWTSSPRDPESVGFGRVVLSGRNGATHADLRHAMFAVRAVLQERRVECIPVLSGGVGAALFIPFCDCPTYEEVRGWLHDVADEAAASDPIRLSTDIQLPRTRSCTFASRRTRSGGSARCRTRWPGAAGWRCSRRSAGTSSTPSLTASSPPGKVSSGSRKATFAVLAQKLAQQPFAATRR